MLKVEAHRYTDLQLARWRSEGSVYLTHRQIGEPANIVHSTRLTGERWLPAGLPDGAAFIAAAGDFAGTVHSIQTAAVDGDAVFGTGAGCFPWQELAVLDATGASLWEQPLDLGMKRAADVWIVTIRPDLT